jgi:predicted acetyltransferase
MSVEVRRLRDDGEFEQYLNAAIYGFNSSRDGSQMERYRRLYERDWCLGAFDGRTLVAGLTIIPFSRHMLGTQVAMGGVASVASLPESRRSGHVGALLRAALRAMCEAGQPLSGLYTPHFSLYRRFGWEIAHRMVTYAFAPKAMRARVSRPTGTYRRVGPDDWRVLQGLRDQFVTSRNGALVRDETRWRAHVFSDYFRGEHDLVVWSNEAGEARGYVAYTQRYRDIGAPYGETVLRVVDWVALDGEAYSALLNYLLGHDLVSHIELTVSEDEPMLSALDEPAHLREPQGLWPGMMLRVVDITSAFDARPSPAEASGLSVTVEINDEAAAWNAGTWRISSGEGCLRAEPATGGGQLRMDAGALGPLWSGFMTPEALCRAGLIGVDDERAAEHLRLMLAVPHRPFCPDDF